MAKIKISIGIITACLFLITSLDAGPAQSNKNPGGNQVGKKVEAELEAINRRIEDDYLKEKADSILGFYDKAFTYLPEYKPVIYDTGDLKQFYSDWFRAIHIESYIKKIYRVENMGAYVLETGNFVLSYSKKSGPGLQYRGKYMIIWKRSISGKLKIISEAFGSDTFIKPEDMPYAMVVVKETRVLDKNMVSEKLRPCIEAFDKGVVKAVLSGDGEARANEFTSDGMYMPHFDPIQAGMEMIKPYMIRTYTPGVISFVKDSYREIFDLGDFVFLSGHFKVRFDNGINKGSFEGDMSDLMKRDGNGKLLMYCQLAHN